MGIRTVGSQGHFKPVGKRAAAIANVIVQANAKAIAIAKAYANAKAYAKAIAIAIAYANTIAYVKAYATVYAIDDLINLATQLDEIKIFQLVNFTVLIARLTELKAQIPDQKQPQQVHRAFIDRIIQSWLNAFNLTSEMINLSAEELQALDNYLYVNYLIIQCKESAVRVSPQTWEGIEARMLLV